MTIEAFFSCINDARAGARAEGRFGVAEALDDALFMALSAYHEDHYEAGSASDLGGLASA